MSPKSAIFENIGEIKPTGLESCAQSREWYSWSDRIENYINKSQNYQLYPAKELIIPGRFFCFLENFHPLNPGNEIFQKNRK